MIEVKIKDHEVQGALNRLPRHVEKMDPVTRSKRKKARAILRVLLSCILPSFLEACPRGSTSMTVSGYESDAPMPKPKKDYRYYGNQNQ